MSALITAVRGIKTAADGAVPEQPPPPSSSPPAAAAGGATPRTADADAGMRARELARVLSSWEADVLAVKARALEDVSLALPTLRQVRRVLRGQDVSRTSSTGGTTAAAQQAPARAHAHVHTPAHVRALSLVLAPDCGSHHCMARSLQAYELQSNEVRCAVLRLAAAAAQECQTQAAQAPTHTSPDGVGALGTQGSALQLHGQLVAHFCRSALRHMTAAAARSAAKPYGAEMAHHSAAFAATVVRGTVASETLVRWCTRWLLHARVKAAMRTVVLRCVRKCRRS
ncbi:hypothetical protein EON66_04550 [archaeon]|nr:MAG: hypothetical protein EON66_04550 [archaeon]